MDCARSRRPRRWPHGVIQRTHVGAGADEMLDRFEGVDVGHREHRLDPVLAQALEMLEVEFGVASATMF